MENKKGSTILITISRGMIARNLLQNEFYQLVKRHFDNVILLTTAAEDSRFKATFGADNVSIVAMPHEEDSACGSVVSLLNTLLIFNRSTVGHGLYRYVTVPTRMQWFIKFMRFTLVRALFQPLSHVSAVRRMIQWFDTLFLERRAVARYRQLLATYQPDIVFVSNLLEESAILKAAAQANIRTVAMPKTWDNPSKRYFRARADKIISWSAYMRNELVAFHDYRDMDIAICGIPQFDSYHDPSLFETRDEFCTRVGLNPQRKILLFGSEGKIMPSDRAIAQVLHDVVKSGKLAVECQLFIRPHFAYAGDEQKFSPLMGKPDVAVDVYNNPSGGFTDRWDYSHDQMKHFLNMLRHADIVINTCSTLTLDAAALQRPTILIMFEGYEKKPFYAGCARWYVSEWYHELMRYKPALTATDSASLIESINTLLREPRLLEANQRRLCEQFCHRLDGKAGERMFSAVTGHRK